MRAKPVAWTREHLLIAMNLYCKLPFGAFDRNNPLIVEVAEKMGRSSNSLAMKLSNLASLDPVHTARGVKGLTGASQKDRAMWEEFHANLDCLAAESEGHLSQLFDVSDDVVVLSPRKIEVKAIPKVTERVTEVKVRRGQNFFR